VVIRHTFPDGSYRFSFYGHLDPPSVVLRAGDCVARGDVIGAVGRPRGAPHLHFEIRRLMPDRPGPGYWGSDPRLAGWEPPSQFIWDYRIATSPGVEWTQSTTSTSWKGLGELRDGTFGILEDTDVLGVNLTDGSISWRQPISTTSATVMINADGSMIYIAERNGTLRAYGIPDLPVDEDTQNALERSLIPLWEIKLGISGFSTLLPLPGGGVTVFFARQMFGISSTGQRLWNHEAIGTPQYWALGGDYLIVTVLSRTASLWTITESGATAWDTPLRGRSAIVKNETWIYDTDGVYHLHPETLTAERLYLLPAGFLKYGDIAALPDGGVLLAHMEYSDKCLIALNADGTLRWQRSYAGIIQGKVSLQALDDRVYAVVQTDTRPTGTFPFYTSSEITLFAININTTELNRIFTGATRRPDTELTAVYPVGEDHFLIDLGGVSLTLLDLQSAIR
jgi:outer membrane protein assembly factor BamB